jgi:isopentenyl diphosphate isomerase/L-lactate dehydrogenase-like FMN-dependent dehydrogenase
MSTPSPDDPRAAGQLSRRTALQAAGAAALGATVLAAPAQADDPPATSAEPRGDRADPPGPGKEPPPVNVEDFKAWAKATLPKPTFDYITSGSADEITLRENVAAFQRIKVFPPLLRGVSAVDQSTTVLNRRVSLPVLLAPVAGQRIFHPDGALAAARAAAAAGTVFGVSSSAGHSAEEIAEASAGPKWFQLYVPRDRAVARQLVERVERAGYDALVLTVDLGEWKDADRRNRFALPKEVLLAHLRGVGFQVADQMSYQDLLAFNERAWDLSLSWDFFDWLRSVTRLPLVIKGVLRTDDAKKAVAIGLNGIIVSNHGGRRLDGMPASIEMLPSIVETVGDRAEVYLDGGVRRGTDVLKALALGARAVLIGRPYAWARAADGEAGVRKVLELFHAELASAMIATGCAKIGDIQPSLLSR